MHLAEIVRLVVNHWQWTPQYYPILEKIPEEAHGAFKRHHVLIHLEKQIGKLAAVQENDDHGKTTFLNDRGYLVEHLAKLITCTLQLAQTMGITPEELEAYITNFYKPTASPR